MAKVSKISFNTEYVKRVSKAKFIRTFEKVYPGTDLGAEYDKIVPPKKEKKDDQAPQQG